MSAVLCRVSEDLLLYDYKQFMLLVAWIGDGGCCVKLDLIPLKFYEHLPSGAYFLSDNGLFIAVKHNGTVILTQAQWCFYPGSDTITLWYSLRHNKGAVWICLNNTKNYAWILNNFIF